MTLRVGILTYDFVPFIGGQGRVTHDLWSCLHQRADVSMAVLSPSRNALPGHHIRFPFTQRAGKHLLFSLLASARVAVWCRELKLDVLHVNGGPGGVLMLRDPGIPTVSSVYHTYDQVARLTPGQGWKRAFAQVERETYRRADRIIASTPSTATALRRSLGSVPPLDVISCGVDLDAFRPMQLARENQTILFVGRLDVRKNPQLAIRAFARVVADWPAARLVLVGRGSMEPELRALVAKLGLGSRVSFERFVDERALVDWYNRATVVVVPSLFEGFGLSAAEAQACGACVVATDSDALRDVVTDDETGVLVPGDDAAVADAIAGLLADPGRRARLGAAASCHAREAYAWPRIADEYVRAYHAAAA